MQPVIRNVALTTLASAAILLAGCSKRHPAAPRTKLDACALLTAEDVHEVQNVALQNKVANQSSNGRTYISQCYFAADPPHQSISLSTTQSDPDGGNADAARDYWRQISERSNQPNMSEEEREKRESLKEHERGEQEESAAALKKIDGVGDEAYWAGSRVGGALYVFQKDVVLRVSVGGPDTEDTKIDKSKKIAAKALQRL